MRGRGNKSAVWRTGLEGDDVTCRQLGGLSFDKNWDVLFDI